MEYSKSETDLVLAYKMDNPGGVPFDWPTTTVDPYFPPEMIKVQYYQRLHIRSICEGKATYATMVTNYCTDKPVLTYHFIDQSNRLAFGGIGTRFGGVRYEGSCPDEDPEPTRFKVQVN